jgi:hypoxanthine-DNA glycosylase
MEAREDYEEKKDFLLRNHIAIWDVLENCERDGSSDASIRNPKANDFHKLFNQYPNIKRVYFNGKKAEKLYLKLVGKEISNGIMYQTALPSTSPANAIKFNEKLKEWRHILSKLIEK